MPPEELHPSHTIANPAVFVNKRFVQNYQRKIQHYNQKQEDRLRGPPALCKPDVIGEIKIYCWTRFSLINTDRSLSA